jgi:hypothetical protein
VGPPRVRPGAADRRSSDDNGLLALFRQRPGEELARDAAADDQVLKVLDGHDDVLVSGSPFSTRLRNQHAVERIST